MTFITSATDQSYDSLENLYTKPTHSVGYQLKVAALALFLFVSSMNAQAYNTQAQVLNDTKPRVEFATSFNVNMQFDSVMIGGEDIRLSYKDYSLIVRELSAAWQRQQMYSLLLDSFKINFDEGQTDIGQFIGVFQTIARELSQLKINEAFVDVSRKRDMIDFNLNMADGLFLSVAKTTSEESDEVMFTIARNHQTLVIDEMPLRDLITKLNNVLTQMKSISRS